MCSNYLLSFDFNKPQNKRHKCTYYKMWCVINTSKYRNILLIQLHITNIQSDTRLKKKNIF